MAAPSRSELQAATEDARRDARQDPDVGYLDIGHWVHDLSAALRWAPADEQGPAYAPGLWDNLTSAQANRLEELHSDVYRKADALGEAAIKQIMDWVVEAGETFAAEYPNANRSGDPKPVGPLMRRLLARGWSPA